MKSDIKKRFLRMLEIRKDTIDEIAKEWSNADIKTSGSDDAE